MILFMFDVSYYYKIIFNYFLCSSLLIVYEGCEERREEFPSPDFHFSSRGRSSSDCELNCSGGADKSALQTGGYQPSRSFSDAQIQRLKKTPAIMEHDQLDLDSLSISISHSSDFLMDDTQSFSTSPLSVDSGLECLDSTTSGAKCFQRLLRTSGYECENSTDSTDSGVSGHGFQKRCCTDTEDTEESESELDHLNLYHHLDLDAPVDGRSALEDEGELTPVASHQPMDFDQLTKKRRMEHGCRSEGVGVDVRMIDFAHTTFSGYLGDDQIHWGPDNGYLLGLDSLTAILNEMRHAMPSC